MSEREQATVDRERTGALTPPGSLPTSPFTPGELEQLLVLRARYQQDRDVLTASELARLTFVRWLYQTGRLTS